MAGMRNTATKRVTSLNDAVAADDIAVARQLLDAGANPNQIEPRMGRSPLYIAAECGHVQMVTLLLRYGADPNLPIRYVSPVNRRVQRGVVPLLQTRSKKIAGLLIKAGANINAADSHGRTPLMAAAVAGELALAQLLVLNGANVVAKDRHGHSAADLVREKLEWHLLYARGRAGLSRRQLLGRLLLMLERNARKVSRPTSPKPSSARRPTATPRQ
jgi:hypothetical protein